MKQAIWDGTNLGVVQMLAPGSGAVRVDADWNLSVMTAGGLVGVPAGHTVIADENDHLTVRPPV
jgi:hypothetical protein